MQSCVRPRVMRLARPGSAHVAGVAAPRPVVSFSGLEASTRRQLSSLKVAAAASADAAAPVEEAEQSAKAILRYNRGSPSKAALASHEGLLTASSRLAIEQPDEVMLQDVVKGWRAQHREVRRVLDVIRGRTYFEALAILEYMPYRACEPILKTLLSAAANAKHNMGMQKSQLVVSECYCDEGPTMKRLRPRAQGRSAMILKRTCHITVKVAEA